MKRQARENKVSRRDIAELIVLFMIFLGLLYNDLLISAVRTYFLFGIILSAAFGIVVISAFFVAKNIGENKEVSVCNDPPPIVIPRVE